MKSYFEKGPNRHGWQKYFFAKCKPCYKLIGRLAFSIICKKNLIVGTIFESPLYLFVLVIWQGWHGSCLKSKLNISNIFICGIINKPLPLYSLIAVVVSEGKQSCLCSKLLRYFNQFRCDSDVERINWNLISLSNLQLVYLKDVDCVYIIMS